MKRAFLCALVVSVGLSTGCIKSSSDAAVKGDGSATVKLSVSYDADTFENKVKKAPDSCTCWWVYQVHQDSLGAARRAISAFESGFNEKRLAEAWAKLGLQVSKSSSTTKNGWTTLEVEASAASVADFNAKLAAMLKANPDEYLTKLPWFLHTRKLLPRLPHFYKTSDPTVVKAVIPLADVGPELAELSPLSEEARTKLGKQLTYMRALRNFDEGQIKVRVKLPGTITAVENAKQEGSDTVVFDLSGPGVDPDVISAQGKAKGRATVTLKVDPATFKIPLETE
jgi:hypothetical protein